LLTIVYTSGTTGRPKGCCILQRHYVAMVDMVAAVPGLFAGRDRVLLFLPLAHTFARLVQYAGVGAGFTTAFCRDSADVPQALQAVRPTIFPSVPRVFEKTYDAVSGAFAQASGVRGGLVGWALGVGRKAGACRLADRPLPRRLALQHALADRLVYSKVKARLGGELRYAISGGAPLRAEIAEFLHSLDIVVLEGYGLTECTTASHFNQPRRYRFGTVGLPLDGVETRLAGDGEILLRAPTVFAGYWNEDDETRAAVDADGWLHTGDVGSIDADGFLTITDRKKDLIVTSGGKNVAPQPIEAALAASPYVAQALVVGDARPYLVALLVPDGDVIAAAGVDGDPRALLEQAVAEVNGTLGRVEQIKRFAVLERPFSIEDGEMTPTLKLRRRVCEERARDEIESLYAAPLPREP
jgi:long-chain acyl-CoA synthetase